LALSDRFTSAQPTDLEAKLDNSGLGKKEVERKVERLRITTSDGAEESGQMMPGTTGRGLGV
jgi:hypothetical protein